MSREHRQDLGPTADPRRQSLQKRTEDDAMRRYKRDVRKLLATPEFRRFMAQLIYGDANALIVGLKLKAVGAWKRDSEIHREAARRDVAAELLQKLAAVDSRGVLLLEQEHINRLTEEAEAAGRLQENLDAQEDA